MNCKVICVVLSLAFVALAAAGPVVDDKGHIENSVLPEQSSIEESLLKKLNSKCAKNDFSSCMMLKLVTYFNRMLKKSSIDLGEVQIEQTTPNDKVVIETSRSLLDASEDAQLSQVIADKIFRFASTRSLKWQVVDGADVVVSGSQAKDGGLNMGLSLKPSESSENGDARKKKGNDGMGAIIAAAVMKIGLLKALAFKALVLLVGKALLVSKLALVLAAVIGLKKLLHQEKHVTYEVVAQPHHEHHEEHHPSGGHESYGGGWGRNFDAKDAQKMAYSAQIPPQ